MSLLYKQRYEMFQSKGKVPEEKSTTEKKSTPSVIDVYYNNFKTAINPTNFGKEDYSHIKDYGEAFKQARLEGGENAEFMWTDENGQKNRYNTKSKRVNPYASGTYSTYTSLIPTATIKRKLNIDQNSENPNDPKIINTTTAPESLRELDLNTGSLAFARTGDNVAGDYILGGDFIENETVAKTAGEYRVYETERFAGQGNKVKLDNTTQLYYGTQSGKLKVGNIAEFNGDTLVVPIRWGGSYDLQDISGDKKTTTNDEYASKTLPIFEEWRGILRKGIKSEHSIIPFVGKSIQDIAEDANNVIMNKYNLTSKEVLKLRRANMSTKDRFGIFKRDGKTQYTNAGHGKLILYSKKDNAYKYLYGLTTRAIFDYSQKFKKEHPDAGYITLDTGRYNFMVGQKGGLTEAAYKKYASADFFRGKNKGYNLIYRKNKKQ